MIATPTTPGARLAARRAGRRPAADVPGRRLHRDGEPRRPAGACRCPAGFTAARLPVGLQLIGPAARRGDGAARGRRVPAPHAFPRARCRRASEHETRLLIIAAALAVAVRDPVGVALYLFDVEKLRDPLQKQASAALGREVTRSARSRSRSSRCRRCGSATCASPDPSRPIPPFAQIDELRLRVAILPLLAKTGRAARARARLAAHHIPFDKDGKPILPGPRRPMRSAKPARREKPTSASARRRSPAGPRARGRPDRDPRRRRRGGPVEDREREDRRAPRRSTAAARSEYSIDLPGLGGAARRRGRARGARRAPRRRSTRAASSAPTSRSSSKRFALHAGGLRPGARRVRGRAARQRELRAATRERRPARPAGAHRRRWSSRVRRARTRCWARATRSISRDTRIEKTGVFAKPKRTTLSVTGKLGREPSLAALSEALVKIGANELPLGLELDQKPMKVHLRKIDARPRERCASSCRRTSRRSPGSSHVDGLDVQLDPLRVTGNAHARQRRDHGSSTVPSASRARCARKGETIGARERDSASSASRRSASRASYDLPSGAIAATFDTANSQLGALVAALSGRERGRRHAHHARPAHRARPPDVNALAGNGRHRDPARAASTASRS